MPPTGLTLERSQRPPGRASWHTRANVAVLAWALLAVAAALPLTALTALTALPSAVPSVPGWVASAAWAAVLVSLLASVALAATTAMRSRVGGPSPTVLGTSLGAAVTALALVFALTGTGTDGGGGGGGDGDGVVPTGRTRTVEVTLDAMSISPATVTVDPGDELVLEVVNEDAQRHDLRLDNGARTPALTPGESATLEVGVVSGRMEGWCTLMGHRAAGMEMTVLTGDDASSEAGHDGAGHDGAVHGAAADVSVPEPLDLAEAMGTDWEPRDPVLAPASEGGEHEVEIRVTESEQEVAPGVRQPVWTFGGTVPGPVLRGKVGDVFTVTLINDGSIGHSIDFHAGALAPDGPMRTIDPGEKLTYRFTAEQAGAWLYHCATMPMSHHLGNGMYGAVVIDPPDLAEADREYLLVQGELYLDEPGSPEQTARLRAGTPHAWAFNGTAAGYDHAPLTARAGERVRIWVVTAGPADGTSFHVVGAQFDTVYKEGAYLLRPDDDGGAQSLGLSPAQGGFVETVFPEPGTYPFTDHALRRGENGAHGIFEVEEEQR